MTSFITSFDMGLKELKPFQFGVILWTLKDGMLISFGIWMRIDTITKELVC
jgi:hypothetical protein